MSTDQAAQAPPGPSIQRDPARPPFATPDTRALPPGWIYFTARPASPQIQRLKGGRDNFITAKVSFGYPGHRLDPGHDDLRFVALGDDNEVLILYAAGRIYALMFIIPVDADSAFWNKLERICAPWAANFWAAMLRALMAVVRGAEQGIRTDAKRLFELPIRRDVLEALLYLQCYVTLETWADWAAEAISERDSTSGPAEDVLAIARHMQADLGDPAVVAAWSTPSSAERSNA